MASNVRHVGDVPSDLSCCGFSCNPVKRSKLCPSNSSYHLQHVSSGV